MNQYLLLRDNKQTGPFTAQELAAKGIKPYDLVWQEGRSAAWRYPSEIEELKAFAPVVEEQPYDRFYKKPGEQATETSTTTNTQAANAVQEYQPASTQAEQTAAKHIHVTMPVTAQAAKKEETAKPVAQPINKNVTSNNNKKAAVGSYIISEEDDELNSGMLKGYQSRKQEDDEINSGYMSDYESRKAAYQKNKSTGAATVKQEVAEKPATPQKETWSSISTTKKKDQFDLKALLAGSSRYFQDNKNMTRGLVAAVLILGGVVIGLIINSGHRQPDTQVLESLVKEIRDQRNEKTAATASPETDNTQQGSEPREEKTYRRPIPNNNAGEPGSVQTIPANNTPVQPVTRHAIIKKENGVVTPPQNQNKSIVVPVSNPAPQPVESAPAVTEQPREKAINQEVLEKARKNIYEQVRVEASAFKVGLLGGISDLDLTLQNTSLYPLDQVAVEVKYFGMEKKLVKTQTIVFNNVPPGKRRTLEVPSTKRGITIDYSVTSINSKALGMAQAGF